MFRAKYPAVDHERTAAAIRLLGQIRDAVIGSSPLREGAVS